MNIEDIFKANASSIIDTFQCYNSNCGFRIPIYQRQYDWSTENIERLFDDIINGLLSLGSDESTLTFLGTVLLVKDDEQKENTFNGQSLSVVDGQQRLTTLALMMCLIQNKLFEILNQLANISLDNVDAKNWLNEEMELLINRLFDCITGSTHRRASTSDHHYYPRIVRQIEDTRASNARDARYHSLIADYLFKFGTYARKDTSAIFTFDTRSPDDPNLEAFERNIETIDSLVEAVSKGKILNETLPEIDKLLSAENFRGLLQKVGDDLDSHNVNAQFLSGHDSQYIGKAIRLLIFGNYVLERVAITRVEAHDERYAFDIFEALNTTGEPLTAIETFKPRVIEFEENQVEGYLSSSSELSLKKVDAYLALFKKNDAKQAESKELVVNFALYVTGDKIGNHLTAQRKYLRQNYDGIGDSASNRRRYVKAFEDLVLYRECCWDKSNIPSLLIGDPDKDLIQFCLGFIRDMKNSLTIPILCRYFCYSQRSGDMGLFKDAVKAITAFLIIRRGATGGTSGIDTDYRLIMSKGKKGDANSVGLKLGVNYRDNVPSSENLQSILRSYLSVPRLGIANQEAWCSLVASQPLYQISVPLCRAMLLIASHNAALDPDHEGLIKKVRENRQLHYMNWASWDERSEFRTVEHVAPDSLDEGWSADIYNSANTRHTLGNLSLLPEKENNTVSNRPWESKKLYYRAFKASTDEELEEIFEEAAQSGLNIGVKTKEFLRSGSQCLPFVENICTVGEWNRDIIDNRSANIASLVWCEVSPWLGL